MIRRCNYLISMAALGALWGDSAQADDLPPAAAQPPASSAPAPAAPSPAAPDTPDTPAAPAAPPPPASSVSQAAPKPAPADPSISDAALAELAEGEAIEIFDERPDKPFDRDTEVRLTGAELAARGATDLATALALLPDVTVREAGRGGFNIDVRGARKGSVSILIDGVLVTDPYYGTFDVSTIPITDIVQIRVATTPQSPLDGPGGPGGVIEVHTRDAIGPQLVIGRIVADSLPSVGMTATARLPLAQHLALRLSASGLGGARDLELPGNVELGEERRAATGAGRLEYRKGDRRIAIDGFLDNRRYVSPPSDTVRSTILLIDRETTARASIKADEKLGKLQLQAQAWSHYLERRSRFYPDPTLTSEQAVENLKALRSGVMALATRPLLRDFRWAASATVDFEKAAVSDIMNQTVRGETTIVEAAGDLQYERGPLRADVAAGIAVPFGVGADPWPEGKAVLKVRPIQDLEIAATGAYKGRVPSLRERFDSDNGNPALGPERIADVELRVIERLSDRLRVEVAPYYKHASGAIRSSPDPMDGGLLINLGTVTYKGVDTQARITPHPMIELGGAYAYIKAHAVSTTAVPLPRDGDDPIDRLPRHRWDGWLQVRPEPRFSALARLKYFGSSIDQTKRVDGYGLVEANLTAQLAPKYLAVLRVDDLLNAQPETRAGYHTAGRVISLIMQGTWD